jgi:hypothetical protein
MSDQPRRPDVLPYRELRLGQFHLLVVERVPSQHRLYVGVDGTHYSHYDSGSFRTIDDAAEAARRGFDPGPFLAFPYAPLKREDVLEQAPHGLVGPDNGAGG